VIVCLPVVFTEADHLKRRENKSADNNLPPDKFTPILIPAWLLGLKPSLFRRIHRSAKSLGITEEQAIERAIAMLEGERKKEEQSDDDREKIKVKHVGLVTLTRAKEIYGSISGYFASRNNMTPEDRTVRAKKAAEARWGKKDPE
jgi:hypothetical protein